MTFATPAVNPRVRDLIRRIDEAMTPRDDAGRCRGVKQVLEDTFAAGCDFLDARFLEPNPDRYARRLVHRDPEGRYTVIAMVWNTGQGTPLHDHAGIWCVECVYKGHIKVTSYSCRGGDPERDLVRFQQEAVIHAGVGEAGALIPPFEYHVLENADTQPSVTLHIYGGEMDHCHIFEPPAGDLWFVVVGTSGSGTEGSWGKNAAGVERDGATASGQCGNLSRDNSGTCP